MSSVPYVTNRNRPDAIPSDLLGSASRNDDADVFFVVHFVVTRFGMSNLWKDCPNRRCQSKENWRLYGQE